MTRSIEELLVTVIVPVYNTFSTLKKCINSIISQTYHNLEIIIVDDGSSDGSSSLCDEFRDIDDRITVIHKKNEGLVKARKSGLSSAHGEYIVFVDSDDYIDPGFVQRLYEIIYTSGVDFVHSGFKEIDIQDKTHSSIALRGNELRESKISIHTVQEKKDFLLKHLYHCSNSERIYYSIWSKIYKADLIKKAYQNVPDDIQIGEDGISLLNCIREADSVYLLPECYYNYMICNTSMSHKADKKFLLSHICFFSEFLKINDFFSGDFDEYCGDYIIDQIKGVTSMVYHDKVFFSKYSLPNKEQYVNSKVALYGIGAVGRDYYRQLVKIKGCEIAGVFDENYHNNSFQYCEVKSPDELAETDYDYLIIAIKDQNIVDDVIKNLKEKNINGNIVWEKPVLEVE